MFYPSMSINIPVWTGLNLELWDPLEFHTEAWQVKESQVLTFSQIPSRPIPGYPHAVRGLRSMHVDTLV